MGRDLAEQFSAAKAVFEETDKALGFSLSTLCFEGPAEQLQLTENTQPAILAVSIAALQAMEAEGFPRPDCVAGHSLGEYSALVAAEALSLTEAVCTVRARGRYMQEAVPIGTGAMAAVMGANLADIERICAIASEGQICAPANINTPNQVVIAGNFEAIERASKLLKTSGAKRVSRLNVSAPFHCLLMRPAQERLAPVLAGLKLSDPQISLVSNVDAQTTSTKAEARQKLIDQVSSPVRWLESIELMISEGVDTFVEVGPGRVLSGLIRQISRQVKCFNVEDSASLRQTLVNLRTDQEIQRSFLTNHRGAN